MLHFKFRIEKSPKTSNPEDIRPFRYSEDESRTKRISERKKMIQKKYNEILFLSDKHYSVYDLVYITKQWFYKLQEERLFYQTRVGA